MRRRLVLLALLPALAVLLWGAPAAAHTEFESSDPADGAVLEGPVDTVTVVFTADAEPAGEGFEVLDPSGVVRAPTVSSPDGRTFVLGFDEPLTGGVVGVRWSVRAGDAHPIDGSFTFTAGPAPSTTTAPANPADTDPGVAAGPPTTAAGPPTSAAGTAVPASGGQDEVTEDSEELAAFLEDDDTAAADALAALGRTLQLLGAVVGLGALAFATWVLRGDRRDLSEVLAWARRGAVLVLAGSVVRLGARAVIADGGDWAGMVSPSALGDVLGSAMGISLLLAVTGAVLLGLGARTGPGAEVAGSPSPAGAATTGEAVPVVTRPRAGGQDWRPPALAVAGALGVLGSFLFDGHTVTEGNRVVHSLVDVVHVASAAVWGGGVLMLAAVARRRRRAGDPARVPVLAARFSVIASAALAAAGLAGVALSVIVADSVSDLWSTTWGRLLLVKVALVGVAAAIGAWNHFVMVPRLEEHPDDRALVRRFAGVLRAESAVLVAVVVVTGLLVGASTT